MISITFRDLSPVTANLLVRFFAEVSGDTFTVDSGHVSQTMSGADYINSMDQPDAGTESAPSAAAVFTAGVMDAVEHGDTSAPVSAASAFATPVRQMTISAGAYTYEQYRELGWSDDQLIAAGHMLPPAPPPPPAVNDMSPPNVQGGAVGTPPPPPGTVSTPPAPPNAHGDMPASVMLDGEGIAWDARIHSSGRTQTKGGIWTAKKGVDAGLVAQVKAAQRGAAGAATPFTPLVPTQSTQPSLPPSPPAPPPPPNGTPGSPSSPTQSPSNGTPATFTDLCKYITERSLGAKVIPICEKYGMAGIGLMAQPSNFNTFIEPLFADLRAL